MPDTYDTPQPDTQAEIRLRPDRFRQMWGLLGVSSNVEIARRMGLSRRQVVRAQQGAVVGEVFMAASMSAFAKDAEKLAEKGHEVSLDYLFEVVGTGRAA